MNAFNDNTSTFAITSKSILADQMAIMALDVDQSPAMLNAAEIDHGIRAG
ncbi:tail fiber protein [Pseudomonas phage WP1]